MESLKKSEKDKVWKIRKDEAGSILIGHFWVRSDSLFLILSSASECKNLTHTYFNVRKNRIMFVFSLGLGLIIRDPDPNPNNKILDPCKPNPDPDILIFRSGYPDPDPYF